jgi:twitching motility protein PilJ
MSRPFKTLAATTCILLGLGQSFTASAAGDLATEMSLQFTRYVNAALHSGQGEADAAHQLGVSAGKFDAALNAAIRGGIYRNCTYAPAPQSAQGQLGSIAQAWKYYESLGDAIQQNQPAMQRFTEATKTINQNTPELLELAEQAAVMIIIQGNSPPTNVSAAGQLEMLVERLNNSASLTRLERGVNPEAVFLIGKDSNQFRDIVQALLNGSKVLRTVAVKGDARAKLNALDKALDTDIAARDIIMDNLKAGVTVRKAIADLDDRSETFYHQLQMLPGNLPQTQDCR